MTRHTFPGDPSFTRVALDHGDASRLPVARWLGVGPTDRPWATAPPGVPLLVEQSRGTLALPGLSGYRREAEGVGRSWSTAFTSVQVEHDQESVRIEAVDDGAQLALSTEIESLVGGALRIRHVLTNTGGAPYLLDRLLVSAPVPDHMTELLDFTGRHERERVPQRRPVTDGLWLRESRGGRPGLESATLLIAGEPGFGFAGGQALAMAVATTGNSTAGIYRDGQNATTLYGGELLLPGEVVLQRGESYRTPWVVLSAGQGLDALAARLHAWQRSLPTHPGPQPVTLNVWEAVYFDHDYDRLLRLAELAARVGVERFVLDDGWFHARRDDTAGLGDWVVDPDVWPDGLRPLADRVHELGMQFGLWFEPEMVNPDSDLFRTHPDWALAAHAERLPRLDRNQLVLDLTRPEAFDTVLTQIDTVLSDSAVDYVKWDHNREVLEAGSLARGGAPAAHAQTTAYLRLLDELRSRHPTIEWESCASGGGRIDLEVIEHVQRFWTSDMTDALSRQQIQRWTTQLVAPEYLGAHVSAPTSHQTGRTLPLDFRAATALFGSFGIEWDLTSATDDDLDRLAEWVARYTQWREVLQTGRVVRLDVPEPAVIAHGVVATDLRRALLAHVQMDEASSNRGVTLRLRGLHPALRYRLSWAAPIDLQGLYRSAPLSPDGPTGGTVVHGAELLTVGLWIPRRRPQTVSLIAIEAEDD